ncbi:class II aldolase/adducin family protein [Ensifer sp. B1-9]|uniref:class II aldolase/adducin family protein n=1 Tax=Ensifer sp. B1-9 TaxID=3141455 RepID=UPI003D1D7C26
MDEDLKRRMIEAGRILEQAGQGDWTRGHLSVRVPGAADRFYMKASKIGLEEMTLDNIITVGLDGEKIEGEHGRHNEVFIHSELLRARPDVNAVVHTHAPHAVSFSALGKPLQAIGHPGAIFAEGLPVFSETTELITTSERGRAVAAALGAHGAMLLQNHGLVTAAPTIEQAVYLALSLENACMMQLWVEAAGGAKALGKPDDIKAKRKHMFREEMFKATFAYLVRRLTRG